MYVKNLLVIVGNLRQGERTAPPWLNHMDHSRYILNTTITSGSRVQSHFLYGKSSRSIFLGTWAHRRLCPVVRAPGMEGGKEWEMVPHVRLGQWGAPRLCGMNTIETKE